MNNRKIVEKLKDVLDISTLDIYKEVLQIHVPNKRTSQEILAWMSAGYSPALASYQVLGENVFTRDLHTYHLIVLEKKKEELLRSAKGRQTKDLVRKFLSVQETDLVISGKSDFHAVSKRYADFVRRQKNKIEEVKEYEKQ